MVKVVLSLPLAKSEFTEDKQSKFREAIATAAGAKPADVTIDKILASVGRRLLSELILVHTSIKAADQKAGDAIATSLTTDRINGALQSAGLPKATIKEAATVETVRTDGSTSRSTLTVGVNTSSTVSSTTAPLTVGIVGVLVLLTVVTWW